jgi:hypothetical protein
MAVNLADLDIAGVRDHYLLRERTSRRLRQFFEAENAPEFVRLAGVTAVVIKITPDNEASGQEQGGSSARRDYYGGSVGDS